MANTLAVSQAPHASRYNGGEAVNARQYYMRPTQREVYGPRIADEVAGMSPGDWRTIWADSSGSVFTVRSPVSGTYSILDWNPRAVFDPETQQIIVGGKRIMFKNIAYSDVTGDWRSLPLPLDSARTTGTGHWYGLIADDDAGNVYLGFGGATYHLDPETEQYTRLAGHLTTNGGNGAMMSWGGASGLFKYAGDAQRWLVYNPDTNTWTNPANMLGNGMHALVEYSPQANRTLIVGGSGTSTRAMLVTNTGVTTLVTSCPQTISMSAGSWIVAHPSGCWLVRAYADSNASRVYAVWPNAEKTDVEWQDLGVAPDATLQYSTAAVDHDRNLIYIVATTGIYAWMPPVLVAPDGVFGELHTTLTDVVATLEGTAGGAGVYGELHTTLTDITATLTGTVTASGTLSATISDITASLAAGSSASGVLAAVLEDATATLEGTTAAVGELHASTSDVIAILAGYVTITGEVHAAVSDAIAAMTGDTRRKSIRNRKGMNYLQLCQRVHSECGLSGSGPQAVTNQTGVSAKIVSWVRQAWDEIQLRRPDWRWMWRESDLPLVPGVRDYNLRDELPDFGRLLPESVTLLREGQAYRTPLQMLPLRTFQDAYGGDAAAGAPAAFTVTPDAKLRLSAPADAAHTLQVEYQVLPQELTANLDLPEMPEAYHIAIVYLAVLKYAAHDDHPQLAQDAKFNYEYWFGKLVDAETPAHFIGGVPLDEY